MNAYADTVRVSRLIGHAYTGTVMDGGKNYGDISQVGESRFYIGGMASATSMDYQNRVQGGNIESPCSAVIPFQGMSAPQSAGNILEITVTRTASTSVSYL